MSHLLLFQNFQVVTEFVPYRSVSYFQMSLGTSDPKKMTSGAGTLRRHLRRIHPEVDPESKFSGSDDVNFKCFYNYAQRGGGRPGTWLPDGYSRILRLYVFGPSGSEDYGSATLRCKI